MLFWSLLLSYLFHDHNNSGFALMRGARYFWRLLIKRRKEKHGTFFSEVGLRKFLLATELFVPRFYFIRYLTTKRGAKIRGSLFNFFFKEGHRFWGQNFFLNFIMSLDSFHDSWENEVLFVKIEAMVLDLLLDTSSGPKWPKCIF